MEGHKALFEGYAETVSAHEGYEEKVRFACCAGWKKATMWILKARETWGIVG